MDRNIRLILERLNKGATFEDLYNYILDIYNNEKSNYRYLGVRLENKDRREGDKLNISKHNPDRDDERDFPDYDSDEYDNLPSFGGTSAWEMDMVKERGKFNLLLKGDYNDWDEEIYFDKKHMYIIGGDRRTKNVHRDWGEIIIENAEVVDKVF